MNGASRRLYLDLKALILDENGSYLALTGLVLTGVLGFGGMGIDLSM